MRTQTAHLFVVMAAGSLVLAGCGSSKDSSSPTTTAPTVVVSTTTVPSTSSTATPPASTSTVPSAGSYYLYATSAKTQGASVTITGTSATFSSGGADDGHWVNSGKQIATVLALTQPVNVLTSATETKQIKAADLPAYLPTDQWGKLFRIDGDVSVPEGLTEIYHP